MKFVMSTNGVLEKVEQSSHVLATNGVFSPITGFVGDKIFDPVVDNTREFAYNFVEDFIIGTLMFIRDFLVDTIGAIALVGGGILILLRLAGFEKGYKWAGILFMINIFVKYLLGG